MESSLRRYEFLPDKTLPKQIVVWTRTYDVLGYYKVRQKTSYKVDRTAMVLRDVTKEDMIVTKWPMKIDSAGKYEEIY
jgi:hypothetical protein